MSNRPTFQVPAGEMSYVDEGTGPPIVFVHGNPSSSMEFQPAIAELRDSRRCIAPDHIGFGRSDKPTDWDYLPSSHGKNLAALLDSVDLQEVTMVVGDWGGPIGLSWVLDNPDRVSALVITNTWLWPVNRSLYYQAVSKMMGGPLGRFLTRRFNLFARQVTRSAWGEATPLTPEIHSEFTSVHRTPDERKGMWVFPREIVGSSEWLARLWERRETLHKFDMRVLWGMKDIGFPPGILDKWIEEFPEATVERLEDVGHFPALEATGRFVATLQAAGPGAG